MSQKMVFFFIYILTKVNHWSINEKKREGEYYLKGNWYIERILSNQINSIDFSILCMNFFRIWTKRSFTCDSNCFIREYQTSLDIN